MMEQGFPNFVQCQSLAAVDYGDVAREGIEGIVFWLDVLEIDFGGNGNDETKMASFHVRNPPTMVRHGRLSQIEPRPYDFSTDSDLDVQRLGMVERLRASE